jgi:putative transposase
MSNITTRKIEIFVCESDNDKRKEYYKQLRDWSYVSRNYANDVMNLLQSARILDNMMKDIAPENSKGLSEYIDTSKRNLGYKLLANKYKEILPSSYRTCINSYVFSNFGNTIKDVLRGDRTINSYKKDFPLLFMAKSVVNLTIDDLGGSFEFYKIPLRFNFGRDKSNNRDIIEKITTGQYKMCDSSLKFVDNKLFMFVVVKMPIKTVDLDVNRVLGVDLGIQYPAYVSINNDKHFRQSIGSAESFLNVRLSLQKQRRSLQRNLKYTSGGHGRKNKLGKMDDIKDKERNFAKTMNHTYSKEIVDLAIKNNCGVINIEDLKGFGKSDKNGFILRNWSFFELQSFIQYKADRVGIKVNVVNPRYSSQRCSKCGFIHTDNRETQSKFECGSCGFSENADYNASKNISIANTTEYQKDIEKHIKNLEKNKNKIEETLA